VFNKKLLLLILCSSVSLLIAGLTSELCLGDEAYQYGFTRDIYQAGTRVAFSPLYGTGNPPGYYYNTGPLWNSLLAILWGLTGGISPVTTQLYQTAYYALLILSTYLLGKELYGEREGLYAALIISTTPMVAAFGILLYTDISVAALSVLCFLMIAKKRYLWAGIVLGLMCLTKRNACFFVPAFVLLIYFNNNSRFLVKTKNLLCFFAVFALFIVPDLLWREKNLVGTRQDTGTITGIATRVKTSYKQLSETKQRPSVEHTESRITITPYSNSLLSNHRDLFRYLGPVLLILICLYFTHRRFQKKDMFIWIPVFVYMLIYAFFFWRSQEIRYIMPVVPLLAIISSKSINLLNKRWMKAFLLTICILQLIAISFYVRTKRQIQEPAKEGFEYISRETAKDALILYPGYILSEATNRKMIWASVSSFADIFWPKSEKKIESVIKQNNLDYIVIDKSRIYDDSMIHHCGGYPKSFVERLPHLNFLQLVFENQAMSIWKIKQFITIGSTG
jgi:4-amino-4-deoxy-L-arabinose transferase-like glycosyltransferase